MLSIFHKFSVVFLGRQAIVLGFERHIKPILQGTRLRGVSEISGDGEMSF